MGDGGLRMTAAINSRFLLVIPLFLILAITCSYIQAKTVHVDDDADAINDGTSWIDAYKCLQDALTEVRPGDEIRVAQGIYKPDQRYSRIRDELIVKNSGDRKETFQLINGATLKGGYAGIGEPDPDARDIKIYQTILSGDLNGDDGPNFTNSSENSYHVVTGSRTDATAILDGFIVCAGHADGSSFPDYCGGGMYTTFGNPTVVNCTFRGNYGFDRGGGMFNYRSHPTVTNCTFNKNSARFGGGICNVESESVVSYCTFSGNSVMLREGSGGGMSNSHGRPVVIHCTFIGNTARNGGGMEYNNVYSKPPVTHCIFNRNSASGLGGGLCNIVANPILTNCTFVDNSAEEGNAIASMATPDDEYVTEVQLINSILMDGDQEIWNYRGSIIHISYCNICVTEAGVFDPCEAVIWGEGNIDMDPLFARLSYWDNKGTRDPSDDVWVEGDFHLKSQAGRWDSISGSWIVDDVTSPCIDAGDPNSPVASEPLPSGGVVNMGAYGGTSEASKSLSDQSVTKYSGGTGETNNPYQIATAEDLMLLSNSPEDYDKHFILITDIDLDPNLPGRKIFNRAVIAPDEAPDTHSFFWGVPFTGVFSGNGYTISHLTIAGGDCLGLFGGLRSPGKISNLGLVGVNILTTSTTKNLIGSLVGDSWGEITCCYSTGTVKGWRFVGGLVGWNEGNITMSYSTCKTSGIYDIGGLVGGHYNGNITNSYSIGAVSGNGNIGGLVGRNRYEGLSIIANCYSVGRVIGDQNVGGLVGLGSPSIDVLDSFWDMETSGKYTGSEGTGKRTAEMQIASTFLEAGWDFLTETGNGTDDIWWILEGKTYPRLWWELPVN